MPPTILARRLQIQRPALIALPHRSVSHAPETFTNSEHPDPSIEALEQVTAEDQKELIHKLFAENAELRSKLARITTLAANLEGRITVVEGRAEEWDEEIAALKVKVRALEEELERFMRNPPARN
ncbi:hypothetical protein TWF281_002202 [Arthrobotrys megalospora]